MLLSGKCVFKLQDSPGSKKMEQGWEEVDRERGRDEIFNVFALLAVK